MKEKLHAETAKIAWHELQRFYAQGMVFQVADELDLVVVATAMAEDNTELIQRWKATDQLTHVADQQALQWFENDASVWAVTVAPFILVQSVLDKN